MIVLHKICITYYNIFCLFDPKTVNPAGSWNKVVIKVKDGQVTHTMNGVEAVKYTLWTPEWDELVQNSKFKNFPGFTVLGSQGIIS